jgi:hypothetical protein
MTPPDHITDPRLRKLWESAYRLEVARQRLEEARRNSAILAALEAAYREGPAEGERPKDT